ncbi:hypothetical protein CCM_09338 [Cordyceps militaris CM01]|uniref:HNH nuclease domain-containing protein n=1 Tax=Cordyceps militaris (strain CM01) TaxID=983644 RepID=G3JUI0_CORMM|nr:uncharacterized protein CCM_09338 [Cordyceps militaris CM01]EGX87716.1 hypothetical protein CCM_09338 [Cordyceps militaris CM01]
MHLQEIKFAQALPPHMRSYIRILHPGYISGEDFMLALPRLDEIGPLDKTDASPTATHGVHFATMLVACQVVAGNCFEIGYLSYDVQGSRKVDLTSHGILTYGEYFFHVPQANTDATETASYAVTPNFQEWRFPDRLPPSWQTIADTPHDPIKSCVVTSSTKTEMAHVVPRAQEVWFTNNAMRSHAEGLHSATDSTANVCYLRPDLHKIFDDRAFVLVPKADTDGRYHTVIHFLSTQNNFADVALRHHNRKRQIAVIQRDIQPSGRPCWVTKVMDMDRAERHKRYGGGGSRASSPSKRSRPPSDYQRDALESVDDDDNYVSDWWGENDDGRTAAWVEAAAAGDREDEPRGRKRKRTEEGLLPSLTSSFSCQASHNEPSPPAPASAPGQPSPTSVDTSKKNNVGLSIVRDVSL